MKTKTLAFYLLAALLAGCIPTSLHPLYTEKDVVFDEKLLGTWSIKDENWLPANWEFEKGVDPNSYKMTITDDQGKGEFKVYMTQINQTKFLDFFPGEPETLKRCEFWQFHILPVHSFVKLEQIEPILKIWVMDFNELGEMIKSDPNLIKHEILEDDQILLTASTKELREFMKKHANDEGLFGEFSDLGKIEPNDVNTPGDKKTKE